MEGKGEGAEQEEAQAFELLAGRATKNRVCVHFISDLRSPSLPLPFTYSPSPRALFLALPSLPPPSYPSCRAVRACRRLQTLLDNEQRSTRTPRTLAARPRLFLIEIAPAPPWASPEPRPPLAPLPQPLAARRKYQPFAVVRVRACAWYSHVVRVWAPISHAPPAPPRCPLSLALSLSCFPNPASLLSSHLSPCRLRPRRSSSRPCLEPKRVPWPATTGSAISDTAVHSILPFWLSTLSIRPNASRTLPILPLPITTRPASHSHSHSHPLAPSIFPIFLPTSLAISAPFPRSLLSHSAHPRPSTKLCGLSAVPLSLPSRS